MLVQFRNAETNTVCIGKVHAYHLVPECVAFFTICTLIRQSLHCGVIVHLQWYVKHTIGQRAQNLVFHSLQLSNQMCNTRNVN